MSHIHGNIWVGRWPKISVDPQIKNIVQCCPNRHHYIVESHQTVVRGYLFDADEVPPFLMVDALVTATLEMIDEGPTLVHCKGGINRSPFIAALVMLQRGMSLENTMYLLRTNRSPQILNNEHFMRFLRQGCKWNTMPYNYSASRYL